MMERENARTQRLEVMIATSLLMSSMEVREENLTKRRRTRWMRLPRLKVNSQNSLIFVFFLKEIGLF